MPRLWPSSRGTPWVGIRREYPACLLEDETVLNERPLVAMIAPHIDNSERLPHQLLHVAPQTEGCQEEGM